MSLVLSVRCEILGYYPTSNLGGQFIESITITAVGLVTITLGGTSAVGAATFDVVVLRG